MLSDSQRGRAVVLCVIALLDSLGYNLFVNVLPVIVDVNDPLHYDGVESINPGFGYSVLQFTFCLGAAMFPPFFGRWSDHTGRRPILIGTLVLLMTAYGIQALTQSFWVLAAARFVGGVSGCLRPLAIAYIADMVSIEHMRCRLISSLSLLGALAVGLGPALGAHLVVIQRSYPFMFMSIASGVCVVLAVLFLPEPTLTDSPRPVRVVPLCAREPKKFVKIYKFLVILGFATYFMAMAAASAFPLSLKEEFLLDPFKAGLCSVIDGPLIFASNFFFMKYLTSLSSATKVSVLAAALFSLIALVPVATASASLVPFLMLKYLTSLAGPIVFSAIPQTMINLCPQNVCGSYAGLLTCFNGAGRLTATALVGPIFHKNPSIVYNTVAVMGIISSVLFALLYRELSSVIGRVELKTPLLSCVDGEPQPISRQLSILYSGTPTAGQVSLLARENSY